MLQYQKIKTMIKISTLYVYIKKVYHDNKWSLKINLFTKVFIKRSVLIFGRTQSSQVGLGITVHSKNNRRQYKARENDGT